MAHDRAERACRPLTSRPTRAASSSPPAMMLRFLEAWARRDRLLPGALFVAGRPKHFAAISVDNSIGAAGSGAVRSTCAGGARAGARWWYWACSSRPRRWTTRCGYAGGSSGVKALLTAIELSGPDRAGGDGVLRASRPSRWWRYHRRRGRYQALGAMVAALRTRKLIFLHQPNGLRQGGELTNDGERADRLRGAGAIKGFIAQGAIAGRSRLAGGAHATSAVDRSDVAAEPVPRAVHDQGRRHARKRGAIVSGGRSTRSTTKLRALLTGLRAAAGGCAVPRAIRVYTWSQARTVAIAVALVMETELGEDYLSPKFAVDAEAQARRLRRGPVAGANHGLSAAVLAGAGEESVDGGALKLCDGLMRFPEWHVYWKGWCRASGAGGAVGVGAAESICPGRRRRLTRAAPGLPAALGCTASAVRRGRPPARSSKTVRPPPRRGCACARAPGDRRRTAAVGSRAKARFGVERRIAARRSSTRASGVDGAANAEVWS